MSGEPIELRVLVADSFEGSGTTDFQRSVLEVLDRVAAQVRARYSDVEVKPVGVSFDSGPWPDPGYVAAVVDLTRPDERMAFMVGTLLRRRVACVFLCQKGATAFAQRLGFGDGELLTYGSYQDLSSSGSVLEQELVRAIPETRVHEELIYYFWFPRETTTIWVVCPTIHDAGEYANRASVDYTYLDNLGDADALLEILVFLSQHYPLATIEKFSAADLPRGHTSGNLVVVGGPGSSREISNETCRDMMHHVRSRVCYSEDCEYMVVGRADPRIRIQAEYVGGNKEDGVRQDRGYFARFANPLNENSSVVLVNGIHTAGVLGAARAFSERRQALENFKAVLTAGASPSMFECHFAVDVLNGEVKVPVVRPEDAWSLRMDDGSTEASIEVGSRLNARVRGSVRVLFVSGDRGGSQLNQIQSPKEYHEIQEGLRASRDRDIFSLTNPILAVTRERLVMCYRERPHVIHFVGHGNRRSLSIIDDKEILAGETQLEPASFIAILESMEEPVRLCVLNACQSGAFAQQLVAKAVTFAIGWTGDVPDSAAITFSRIFYGSLGDGLTLAKAFELGRQASGIPEMAVLYSAEGASTETRILEEDNS